MRFIFQLLLMMSLSVSYAYGSPQRDQYRREVREWVMSHSKQTKQRNPFLTIAPEQNDQAADLVDQLKFKNLREMDEGGLQKAALPQAPWSGYYWPTYAGQLANRYADPNYNASLTWKMNYDYLNKNLGRGRTDELSPAEKYDLLVGDKDFTLTHRMIETGVSATDERGNVPTWFGICHGWAPASFMTDRPLHAVSAKAANGDTINFTPSDLKALATLLWANAPAETRFVGGRCNDKTVERDPDNREVNPDCFDTNPATWHMAIVNQLGAGKRSFVMDASAGYEVWNQPVYGYNYGYVNPKTNRSGFSLADAKVPVRELENDPYKAHRAAGTAFIVNVVMSVNYMAETTPSTEETDSPEMDAHLAVTYSYDLELDEKDNILGGEWHSSIHPDFLWVPVAGTAAVSNGDTWLDRRGDHSRWDKGRAVPGTWRQAAKASSGADQPLARVVEALLKWSQ